MAYVDGIIAPNDLHVKGFWKKISNIARSAFFGYDF